MFRNQPVSRETTQTTQPLAFTATNTDKYSNNKRQGGVESADSYDRDEEWAFLSEDSPLMDDGSLEW